jgi:Mn-dependent DtxR family transcriptional regulator
MESMSSAPAAPTELGDHHMESIYRKYHILKEFLKNGERYMWHAM